MTSLSDPTPNLPYSLSFSNWIEFSTVMAVPLAYSVFGKTSWSLPPIAILHGIFGQKRNWRTVGQQLADGLKRQVFVLDARNHGNSPHTQEMSYASMSADVVKFLNDHGISECSIIGHSMGGKTAMITAMEHPEYVERLIVEDVSPTRAPGTGDIMTTVGALCDMDLERIASKRDAEDLLAEQIPDKFVRQFLLTNLERSLETNKYFWRVNLHAIAKNLPGLKAFPFTKKQYCRPTLFLGGSNSRYITSTDIPEIKRIFPNSEIEFVDDAGHWVHTDKPLEFTESVKKFFSSS